MFNDTRNKYVNIFLWILQILLALWNITGGIYMINNYGSLANPWALNALPKTVWAALGAIQVVFALGLVLPGAFRILPKLTSIAAICLSVISLLGIALYVAYAGFPGILWAVVPAILYTFVAYGRWPGEAMK